VRTWVRIRRGLKPAKALLETHWGKRVVHLARWAVPTLLIAYLAWRLSRIGWQAVWQARPGALAFYATALISFYVQPIGDLFIYRNLLGSGRALTLGVLLRKRFINTFLDYSGELYFFFWARKNLRLRRGMLFHAVKDSNVLSASAGLGMIWLMLLAVALSGGLKLTMFQHSGMWTFLSLGSLPLVLALTLFLGGRRVSMLSRTQMLATFAIHLGRGIMQLVLEFMVWWLSGALPTAAACLQFVALRVLVTRLPLVPNKDLIFVGVGIAVAGALDVSAPNVAAVLVLMTALWQVQNLVFVGFPWFLERFQVRHRAGLTAS